MKEYQLTEADIKQLQEWGFGLEEIKDADRVVYTYEDWLNPARSMGPFAVEGWGIHHTISDGGNGSAKGNRELKLSILPEKEHLKIQDLKRQALDKFVEEYLSEMVEWFESQYVDSLEKELLVENELRKIEKLVSELSENYRYEVYGKNLWLKFFNGKGHKHDSMYYWYDKICIRGFDAKRYVQYFHISCLATELHNKGELHFAVSALALNRFKNYLSSKITASNNSFLTDAQKVTHVDKIKPKAFEYLQILGGKNVYGQQIMLEEDFQRLKNYVEAMVEQGKVPEGLEPISQVRFPNGHIRFLFRCIHAEQYAKRKIHDYFIDFIHAVFPTFSGKKEVTKRKFGEEPTTWKPDLAKIKGG